MRLATSSQCALFQYSVIRLCLKFVYDIGYWVAQMNFAFELAIFPLHCSAVQQPMASYFAQGIG